MNCKVSYQRINEAQVGAQDKVNKALAAYLLLSAQLRLFISIPLGGVVKPGETIAEIVPTEDTLMVEAKVTPRDIGFVYPGLPAIVKGNCV